MIEMKNQPKPMGDENVNDEEVRLESDPRVIPLRQEWIRAQGEVDRLRPPPGVSITEATWHLLEEAMKTKADIAKRLNAARQQVKREFKLEMQRAVKLTGGRIVQR